MSTISVVIATFNRAPLLDDCLNHLERQPFTEDDEIVVVDNGSTDGTADVIASHQGAHPGRIKTAVEPRPGKAVALARARELAGGDILSFTDDDVNVTRGWLDAVRRAMADESVTLVGGPVAPRWERRPPRWLQLDAVGYGRLAAPLALLDYGPQTASLGGRAALGANLSIRRGAFEQLDGFATHLGKLRGTLLSGEDHDLCQRVEQAGLRAIYCPEALVTHWVPAARMQLTYFARWFFWSGITHATLERTATFERTLFDVPAFLVRRFVNGVLAAGASAALGRSTAAVERAMDAAFAAGYAWERWGFVRSRSSVTTAHA